MKLLNVSANTTGATFRIWDGDKINPRIVQVDITGTATVKVQGRTASDMAWVDVASYTTSSCEAIQLFTEMRAVSSGMTGATVKVELDARPEIGG